MASSYGPKIFADIHRLKTRHNEIKKISRLISDRYCKMFVLLVYTQCQIIFVRLNFSVQIKVDAPRIYLTLI